MSKSQFFTTSPEEAIDIQDKILVINNKLLAGEKPTDAEMEDARQLLAIEIDKDVANREEYLRDGTSNPEEVFAQQHKDTVEVVQEWMKSAGKDFSGSMNKILSKYLGHMGNIIEAQSVELAVFRAFEVRLRTGSLELPTGITKFLSDMDKLRKEIGYLASLQQTMEAADKARNTPDSEVKEAADRISKESMNNQIDVVGILTGKKEG